MAKLPLAQSVAPALVREIRKSVPMTVPALAAWIRVSPHTVRAWEAGRRTCSGPAAVLMRLLDQTVVERNRVMKRIGL